MIDGRTRSVRAEPPRRVLAGHVPASRRRGSAVSAAARHVGEPMGARRPVRGDDAACRHLGDTWSAVFYIGYERSERRHVLVSLEPGDRRVTTRLGEWTLDNSRLLLTSHQSRAVCDMTVPGQLKLELVEEPAAGDAFVRFRAEYRPAVAPRRSIAETRAAARPSAICDCVKMLRGGQRFVGRGVDELVGTVKLFAMIEKTSVSPSRSRHSRQSPARYRPCRFSL